MKTQIKAVRTLSILLSVLLMVSVFNVLSVNTSAATTTKLQKSYDIAIVFDNSGSMYHDGAKGIEAWCRATYAMEIFASMLDYDSGDKLRIYPMWEVTTDGSRPTNNKAVASTSPVIVTDAKDIDKISKMYTINAGATPFTPVEDAYSYLNSSTASHKWMIVLSDGGFSDNIPKVGVRNRLLEIAQSGINVQYLGFSDADSFAPDEDNGFYTKNSTDESLMSDLVLICNSIFQRSELTSNELKTQYYQGNKLNLDISMKKVIVFIQGQGAKVNFLKDPDGNTVKPLQEGKQRKYSEMGAGAHWISYKFPNNKFAVDKTLYGQVVTFGECPKGVYTLDCAGAEAVQIFYEPDVDIEVSLKDGDNEIDVSSGFEAGEYTITSKIVDGTTKKDITGHELMGNDVTFKTYVKTSDASQPVSYDNGEKITFKPDEATEVIVEATYLKGEYKITTKDDPEAFPLPIVVLDQAVKFKATPEKYNSELKLLESESWKPVKVKLTLEGKELTEEQMKRVSVTFKDPDGLSVYPEALTKDSAYNLHPGRDKNNSPAIPKADDYKVTAVFVYKDEFGTEFKYNCKLPMEVDCNLTVTADVVQDKNWYKISDHESWEPIKLRVEADGQPLTEEQLKNVTPKIEFNKDIPYRYEISPKDSSFNVYIGCGEDGSYVKPETGKYKIKATATYADEYENTFTDSDKESFSVQTYSEYWRWLFWIVLAIIIIIAIIIISNIPTMPSAMFLKIARGCGVIKINGTSVNLSSELHQGEIKCEAKPCTPFKNRNKVTAAFEIKSIRLLGNINWFEIDGVRFTRTNGVYVNDEGETIDQVTPRIRVSDETELKWNTNRRTRTGVICINHRN